jgi:hypothetical protein
MILTELREMDFEEICHTVEAQNLVCEPRNQEHFEAHLPQELEQIASKLPLYICCSGGYYETGSATVKEEDVEISKSSSEEMLLWISKSMIPITSLMEIEGRG